MKISKSTKPLNIDKYLGKVPSRIWRIGVELEGAWDETPKGMAVVRDGSVNIPLQTERRNLPDGSVIAVPVAVGELQSEPMEIAKFRKWMKSVYPHRVNNSCGLHVHMSFENLWHYQALMIPEYTVTMCVYLAEWAKKTGLPDNHPIWNRLDGKSEYCKWEFFPNQQAAAKQKNYDHHANGNRYTVINYCHGQHETLECRVLPMFEKPAMAIEAVQAVLDITNACLQTVKKEPKFEGEVIGKKDIYVEHRHERI